ncbi:MAG: carboxyl transferase domain-containing protein, partial [Pseudomonadota bacterium]
MTWKDETEQIHERRKLAKRQGGESAVAAQHRKGRMTIRERIDTLLDKDTFEEIGMGAGDAELDEDGNLIEFSPANYVLGFGKIDGRRCIVGGEDFTLKGGSPSAAGQRKSQYTE